jgi:hypothetical protein
MLLVLFTLASLSTVPMDESPFPVPPLPPAAVPRDEAAPMPNRNVEAPWEHKQDHVELTPGLFTPKTFTPGDGYLPGSSYKQGEQEHPLKPIPTFNLRVPLQ